MPAMPTMFAESETIELKESLADEGGILASACAFSNTLGGTIYIGVKDSGEVRGISIGKNSVELLARKVTENLTPPVYANIEELIVGDKTVLKVTIPDSEYKPHFYKGIAYKRVGKINKALSPEEMELLFRRKILEKTHFDGLPCENADVSDMDGDSIRRFAEKTGVGFVSTENALKNLKLMKKGRPANAAVLFFGKEPNLSLPLYGVKCAVFLSDTELQKTMDFNENIFLVVDKVVDFISGQVPQKITFDSAERKEEPVVPKSAIREAVINALIHRDYTFPSSVYAAVYKDRIVVKNPGVLPAELSEADLYRVHTSHPRNPLLAELAHKARYIEHWGTGTLRILKSMREAGLRDPIFKQEKGFFYVTLSLEPPVLNKRQIRILSLVKEKKELPLAEIRKKVGAAVSSRTLRTDISHLVGQGFMFRKTRGKTVIYSLLKE